MQKLLQVGGGGVLKTSTYFALAFFRWPGRPVVEGGREPPSPTGTSGMNEADSPDGVRSDAGGVGDDAGGPPKADCERGGGVPPLGGGGRPVLSFTPPAIVLGDAVCAREGGGGEGCGGALGLASLPLTQRLSSLS